MNVFLINCVTVLKSESHPPSCSVADKDLLIIFKFAHARLDVLYVSITRFPFVRFRRADIKMARVSPKRLPFLHYGTFAILRKFELLF